MIQQSPLNRYNLILNSRGKVAASKCTANRPFGILKVYCYSTNHSKFLQVCGSHISTICINQNNIRYADIVKILFHCPNARKIGFDDVKVLPEVVRNLPTFHELSIELIESSNCLLNIFTKSQVTSLMILKNERDENMIDFLHTQPKLNKLQCKGSKSLDCFRSSNNSRVFPFKLEFLSLISVNWAPMDVIRFNFEKLRFFYCNNVNVLREQIDQMISECPNLKRLMVNGERMNIIRSE